jgi:hypothetical protein
MQSLPVLENKRNDRSGSSEILNVAQNELSFPKEETKENLI